MADVKWIKIATNMFDNRKIKLIEVMPEGDAIIAIWFKLLCLAGTTNDSGTVYFTKDIPYTEEMLASIFNRPLATVRLAIATFKKFEMVEIVDDFIQISNWEKYQNLDGLDKIREQTRKRVALHRLKQKTLQSNETQCNVMCNATVTQPNAMKEELKELVADKEQYVIVSQHADASLRCSPLQGLLYKLDVNPEDHIKVVLSSKELGSKKPKEIGKVDGNPYYSLKEAMSYGLFSYNCRHRFIKYIPGQKITPQYQYDSKAAEAKREIDTNMRALERQIRMLKEREVLSLDPKERRLFQKTSKMHYERYCKYAKSHGRVINDWRCSITQSERSYNKSIYRTNGYMPLISPNASEESLEKIIIEEYKKDNILKCDAPSYDELKKNMQKTLSQEQAEEAIHHLKRWTANDDGEDSCKKINSALYSKTELSGLKEKSVKNLKLAIENSGYKTEKGQILYRSDFHNLNEMLKGEYLKIENGAIEVNKALYENRGFISCTNDIKSAINYARDKFEDGMQRNVASPRVIFRIKTDKDIPFVPCEGITLTKGDNEQLFMDGRTFTLKSIDKLTKSYIIINVEIRK